MINFFKKLLQPKKKGFVFTTRNIARSTGNGERIRTNGGSSTINDYADFLTINDMVTSQYQSDTGISAKPKKVDERKIVEPIEVFKEIKTETPSISFEGLDGKISAVEERIKILKEHLGDYHLGDEQRTLFYLKNRKTYLKTKTKNPLDWAITTSDAVNDLCKNYKLKIVPLKQYYTLVPAEGIKEMDRYTKAYKVITGDLPIFELVIKDTEVKAQTKKDRDPILLANSPLGNQLFILGVWDDEVAIVDEIIYGLK